MAGNVRRGSVLASKAKGSGDKGRVVKKTRLFAFANEGDSGKPIDLSTESLVIRLLEEVVKPGGGPADLSVALWEKQMPGERNRSYEILTVRLSAAGSSVSVVGLAQDQARFPRRTAADGTVLWLPARLSLVDKSGAPLAGGADIEFVLPPLELDGVLELQLSSSVGQAVCGLAHVTWSTFQAMMEPMAPIDRRLGATVDGIASKAIRRGSPQRGSLEAIVIHCMAASQVTTPGRSFDVDVNIKILADLGFSAHFIIDRGGAIHQLVDVARDAAHAPPENARSVGIELLGFHDAERERLEKAYGDYAKLQANRRALEQRRSEHVAARERGVDKVRVGKETIGVDVAVARCDKAIVGLDKQIQAYAARKNFDAAEYDDLTRARDADGIPLAFKYTDQQYRALRHLLAQLGRRWGYRRVRSHHSISPERKKDPGVHFDWARLTPVLLPGRLVGNEREGGGFYKVD